MASTTRGSIKISTANGIGAALVDVLGGEGYKPDEWEENINLCGIHAADIESALENIEEDAGTGTERGSILLSTANGIGAMLNKKFDTSRGFSPREWASAISKLEPLPERTVSGAIANITNGADDVPIKNWSVTLPASLSGYSEVNAKQAKKNLIPNEKYQGASTRVNIGQIDDNYSLHLKAGTYTLSATSLVQMRAYYRTSTGGSNVLIWSVYGTSGSGTFTLSEDSDVRIWLYNGDGLSASDVQTFQLEVGSEATAYTAYEAPTQYTASLGRTIYGGTVDIVTGEGSADGAIVTLDDTMSYGISLGTDTNRIAVSFYNSVGKINGTFASNVLTVGENTSGGYKSDPWVVWGSTSAARMWISVPTSIDTVDKFKQYVQDNTITIAYELETPETFTVTPITPAPETALGVNNFWSDEGESSVTYRKDLDIPDPVPGNLLGMNNANNNEEESEG